MKHSIRKSEKKCDKAKEKWINNKCREIDLYHRSTEQTINKNIEEISEKKHAHPQNVLSQKTVTSFWKKKLKIRQMAGQGT